MLKEIKSGIFTTLLSIAVGAPACALAEFLALPENGDNVVGEVRKIASSYEDTFTALARVYNQGYTDMRLANPKVDPWLPGAGTEINLPDFYVLPDAPQDGVVINLAEMRLYYYSPAEVGQPKVVWTAPVGIGREAFPTPEFSSRIKSRIPNPAWYPPQSIIAERAAQGDILPRVVPPGPDNPMGDHAIQLELPGYFIHGTNRPAGIGLRVSHGCIRMYPEDIATLFNSIAIGTPVHVVDQPIKVGKLNGEIYIEVHPSSNGAMSANDLSWLLTSQLNRLVGEQSLEVNWTKIDQVIESRTGIPTAIALVPGHQYFTQLDSFKKKGP